MKEKYHKYIIVILAAFGGLTLGFILGFGYALNLLIDNAVKFLHNQGVDFTIPANQIKDLIIKYVGWMG